MEEGLLETCWRMRGPSGCVFRCGIYRIAAGLVEVRVSHGGPDAVTMVFSHRVVNLTAARDLAERWRQTLLAPGTFHELLH